jgi:hypothetical protein
MVDFHGLQYKAITGAIFFPDVDLLGLAINPATD